MLHKPSALVTFVCLMLATVLIASFAAWYADFARTVTTFPFRVFVWAVVVSDVWLLIVRAVRERPAREPWEDRIP